MKIKDFFSVRKCFRKCRARKQYVRKNYLNYSFSSGSSYSSRSSLNNYLQRLSTKLRIKTFLFKYLFWFKKSVHGESKYMCMKKPNWKIVFSIKIKAFTNGISVSIIFFFHFNKGREIKLPRVICMICPYLCLDILICHTRRRFNPVCFCVCIRFQYFFILLSLYFDIL